MHYWVISQKIAKISFQVQDMGWSSKIKSWPTKYPIWGYAWFYCSCNRKLFMPGCPNSLEVDQSLFREIKALNDSTLKRTSENREKRFFAALCGTLPLYYYLHIFYYKKLHKPQWFTVVHKRYRSSKMAKFDPWYWSPKTRFEVFKSRKSKLVT